MKTFAHAVRTHDFVMTAQLPLTADSEAASIIEQGESLAPFIDAVVVPDNQYGHVHMSSLAAAAILIRHGIDPVLELSCRNRNRVALIGELLGARALGISSLVLIRGRKAPGEIKSQPKFVMDIGAKELIAMARVVNDDPKLASWPGFTIGAVATVHDPTDEWTPARLSEKIDCGAQFIQTQLCFDPEVLRRYMQHLVASRIVHKAHVLAGLAVLPSAEHARRLRDDQPHLIIPDAVIDRLDSARDPAEEGIAICAELMRAAASIPSVSGVNLTRFGTVDAVTEAITRSGLRNDKTA